MARRPQLLGSGPPPPPGTGLLVTSPPDKAGIYLTIMRLRGASVSAALYCVDLPRGREFMLVQARLRGGLESPQSSSSGRQWARCAGSWVPISGRLVVRQIGLLAGMGSLLGGKSGCGAGVAAIGWARQGSMERGRAIRSLGRLQVAPEVRCPWPARRGRKRGRKGGAGSNYSSIPPPPRRGTASAGSEMPAQTAHYGVALGAPRCLCCS